MERGNAYSAYVQELIDRFQFDKFLNRDETFNEWFERHGNDLYDNHYYWGSGACRVVIFHEDWDFVLKFCYDCEEDVDYCLNEAYLYIKAQEWGIENAFAACDIVGKFGLYDIYVMDRCYCNEDGMSDDSYDLQFKKYCTEYGLDPAAEESMDEFSDNCPAYGEQDCMLELAEVHWGLKFTNTVIAFMEEYGINDCHSGNWGWLNNNLVIVDYAGYGEGARRINRQRVKERYYV